MQLSRKHFCVSLLKRVATTPTMSVPSRMDREFLRYFGGIFAASVHTSGRCMLLCMLSVQ